jgi:hypothetical protein
MNLQEHEFAVTAEVKEKNKTKIEIGYSVWANS